MTLPQPNRPLTWWEKFKCYRLGIHAGQWFFPPSGFMDMTPKTICLRCYQITGHSMTNSWIET